MKQTYILGLSAYYHDSAACLLRDGEIVAAAQEERFTRRKHDPGFPRHAIEACLHQGGLTVRDLDFVAFYDKPLLKFERLLETYLSFAPRGFKSFRMAIPVWLREKLFLKDLVTGELAELGGLKKKDLQEKVVFSEHHLSHAASAFYPSPYEEAAILTIDGVGEWATASILRPTLSADLEVPLYDALRFEHTKHLEYFQPMNVLEAENNLVFVGSFQHQPNCDAMLYFTQEILPRIRKEIPAVTLSIVGSKPHAEIVRLAASEAVKVSGYVEDLRPYLSQSSLFIVPLRLGVGIRGKILEAWAMQRPVIATSLACSGLPARHRENLWIADSSNEFAAGIIHLLRDVPERTTIGGRGTGMGCG